jgi:hypothetical protein
MPSVSHCQQWSFTIMVKTQIQLPEELYGIAKAIAKQRQWSLAEVIRRGVEYMSILYPLSPNASDWKLPVLKGAAFKSNFDELDFRSLAEAEEATTNVKDFARACGGRDFSCFCMRRCERVRSLWGPTIPNPLRASCPASSGPRINT